MKIGELEKPVGILEILVYMNRCENATITTLLKDLDLNQRTAYAALKKLTEKRLVDIETVNGFPLRKYYTLTSKGKQVAKCLDDVDHALK